MVEPSIANGLEMKIFVGIMLNVSALLKFHRFIDENVYSDLFFHSSITLSNFMVFKFSHRHKIISKMKKFKF